jgi:hypothetical protein
MNNPDISTVESAKAYAKETFGSQFKQKCSVCGAEKAVTGKVFAERIEKVYALGGNLRDLLTKYHCKSCRKQLAVNVIGGPRPPKAKNTTRVITDIEE